MLLYSVEVGLTKKVTGLELQAEFSMGLNNPSPAQPGPMGLRPRPGPGPIWPGARPGPVWFSPVSPGRGGAGVVGGWEGGGRPGPWVPWPKEPKAAGFPPRLNPKA